METEKQEALESKIVSAYLPKDSGNSQVIHYIFFVTQNYSNFIIGVIECIKNYEIFSSCSQTLHNLISKVD
jgi:hypothetical protein